MGFWVFMLIMNLMIPAVMIGFGKLFIKKAPEEINAIFGYRTAMSMKNRDTWEFAHHYFGKLWYYPGFIVLFLSIIVMLPVIGKDTDMVGYYGVFVSIVQCIVMIVPVFLTERALRRRFDRDGRRRYENL